jgi:hypothetical protein
LSPAPTSWKFGCGSILEVTMTINSKDFLIEQNWKTKTCGKDGCYVYFNETHTGATFDDLVAQFRMYIARLASGMKSSRTSSCLDVTQHSRALACDTDPKAKSARWLKWSTLPTKHVSNITRTPLIPNRSSTRDSQELIHADEMDSSCRRPWRPIPANVLRDCSNRTNENQSWSRPQPLCRSHTSPSIAKLSNHNAGTKSNDQSASRSTTIAQVDPQLSPLTDISLRPASVLARSWAALLCFLAVLELVQIPCRLAAAVLGKAGRLCAAWQSEDGPARGGGIEAGGSCLEMRTEALPPLRRCCT